MTKGVNRDKRKAKQLYTVQLRKSDHPELIALFNELSNKGELSEYLREGVQLINLINTRQWEAVLDAYPRLWELIQMKAPKPQIIVQGGQGSSVPSIAPVDLEVTRQQLEENDDDAFSRIMSDIGI